ncbi:hypothetical protein F183_A06880 [Bryobacterales bacterium F-183]|nr:hypothetical protein F183_A06880 [Bryobacterales bacterium F-183]
MKRLYVFVMLASMLLPAQSKVEANVIYGMYSGMALLMDVHRPEKPNGYGVIFISGSAWTAPLAYSAAPLKSNDQSLMYAKPLVAAGYTVFTLNHRAAPRFRYPAPVEDAQRAVRFIRHNAAKFGIRPDRIGAAGGSSGGHLVSMLGTLDGQGKPDDPDPVERESAKVQCVAARAAPTDLLKTLNAPLLGIYFSDATKKDSQEYKTALEASPITHVSEGDPPFLLTHGDKDELIAYSQSEAFETALRAAGVIVKLVKVPGGGHGPDFPGAVPPVPDYMGETVAWFDRYLKLP